MFDEFMLFSQSNGDVSMTNGWWALWRHDYWSKDLHVFDSNRSYRPITVLSFRLLNVLLFGSTKPDKDQLERIGVFINRLVNVCMHASVAEMVGIVSCKLFPSSLIDDGTASKDDDTTTKDDDDDLAVWTLKKKKTMMTTRYYAILRNVSKLLFGLHPTHVEVAANGANRAHILALLCTMIVVNSVLQHTHTHKHGEKSKSCMSMSIYATGLLFIVGLLSCETAVFHLPAIIVTWIAIRFNNNKDNNNNKSKFQTDVQILRRTVITSQLLPHIGTLTGCTFAYLYLRHSFQILAINQMLFRTIVSPFYHLQGWSRIVNYGMITALHVFKGFYFIDEHLTLGQAHEYARGCVEEIQIRNDDGDALSSSAGFFSAFVTMMTSDLRAWYIIVLICVFAGIFYGVAVHKQHRSVRGTLYYLVFATWFATLFPITGIMTTGTFIADRLVLPCTVASSMFVAKGFVSWMQMLELKRQRQRQRQNGGTYTLFLASGAVAFAEKVSYVLMFVVLAQLSRQVFHTTKSWTTRFDNLQMTLRTCPNSVKGNLEFGMIHVQPEQIGPKLDPSTAIVYFDKALDGSPDFCQVHFYKAIAHQHLQEWDMYELHMAKAIPCEETMRFGIQYWQNYWNLQFGRSASMIPAMKQELLRNLSEQMKGIQEDLVVAVKEWNQLLPNGNQMNAMDIMRDIMSGMRIS